MNSEPSRGRSRRLRGRLFAWAAWGLVLLSPLYASSAAAEARGVILRGETLTQSAIGESLPIANGQLVDIRRLRTSLPNEPYDDASLLLHDLDSGRTEVAPDTLAQLGLVSLDGLPSMPVGGLLSEPGIAIVFEAPHGIPFDPSLATRFFVYRPLGDSASYLVSTEPVPEPGGAAMAALGTLGLAFLARSRLGA